MSVLQYSDGISPKEVQIWNNAAFDSHENHENSAENKPVLIMNSIDSLESFSSKENQSPSSLGFNSSVSAIYSSVSAINSSVSSENSQGTFKKINPNGVLEVSKVNAKRVNSRGSKGSEVRDEEVIDKEIEEIEKEMNRLASRLEALRILKAQKSVKVTEKRGKIVSSKFMEQKQNPEGKKKMEETQESVSMSSKSKLNRRGRSLGPVEIAAGSRRGLSLGPSEIGSGMKSKQFGKQDSSTTPVQAIKNRRKSCFWKLEGIDEEKETKEIGIVQVMRQAVTTIGSKKFVKKDDGVIGSVQPKKLFGNGEKSVCSASAKKPMRQGRVVASRYNQIPNQPSSAIRKRSLPENDKDESRRCEKKRSLSAEKKKGSTFEENKNVDTQSRIKKRWEIPSEIVIHANCDAVEEDESPQSVSVMHHLLPKLRVRRYDKDSPRDSGAAKKVVELIGRKTFFTSDEEMEEPGVCQALSFAEEGNEE